jgi:CheY-like chemotaxis protein
MTTPVLALPQTAPDGIPSAKKRVLLLDTSQTKRDLRADVMRKLGIEVDCAADVLEARSWWRADLYNLVLINVAGETDSRDQFCTYLRSAVPPQRIAFFVGGPQYLAAAPHSDQAPAEPDADKLHKEMVAALLAQDSASSSQQRWGILEACRKISSVRAVSEARTRAIRETPRPSRWAEAIEQHSIPAPITSQALFATETVAAETTTVETAAVETAAVEMEREQLL